MSDPQRRRPWLKYVLGGVLIYVIFAEFWLGRPWVAATFSIALVILIGLEFLVRRSP